MLVTLEIVCVFLATRVFTVASGLSLSFSEWGLPSIVAHWLLTVRASLVGERSFRGTGFSSCARVVVYKLFPEERSNLRPLHRQMDSYLLYLQGSPKSYLHLLMTNRTVQRGYDTSPTSHSLPGAEQAQNLKLVLLDHTEPQVP